MMSCPDFIPGTHCTPTMGPVDATQPLRIGDGIAVILLVDEGLQLDVIECCFMSACIGADWSSIFQQKALLGLLIN